MKRNHRFISLLAIFLLMTISSCQSTPPATNNQPSNTVSGGGEVQNIQVDKVSPQKTAGITEDFSLPNCGGTEKLTQTLGTQMSISKSVQMGTTLSVSGGGEVGVSAAAKLTVEAAVEAEYKQEYETASSRLDTIGMGAAPKTHVIYTIEWEKQEFSSVVTYELDREIVKTPYTFTMSVPKIAGSREEICPTIGLVVPSTPIPTSQSSIDSSLSTPVSKKETNTPVPLPTSTPTSMQTGPRTVGDGFSDGNISLILTDYTIDSNTIDLIFVVKNESNRDILVRYQNSYFTLSDSTGKEYEHITQCEFDTKQELISSGKSVEIERGAPNMACRFDYLSYFKGTISESAEFLLVNVSKFMGLENVQWRIDL